MARAGVKGNSGGKKGRSGRKSKAEEMGLVALLDECWTVEDRKGCIRRLAQMASVGEIEAVKILMSYAFGKPVDRQEISTPEGAQFKVIVEHVQAKPTN